MNFTEMKDFVRTQADTDTTDAPDSTLEVYARNAYNDIRRRVGSWPQQNTSGTLTTTAGTASYVFPDTIEFVTQIVGPDEVLDPVAWTTYLELEDGPDVSYSTREATYYAIHNGRIWLWPKPSVDSVSYTVYGYDTFSSWPSGATEATDLPREFDEAICWFMLSKYYLSQEDLELAQMYMALYENQVNRFVQSSLRVDRRSPRVLGGWIGRRARMGYGDWVRRMTEG